MAYDKIIVIHSRLDRCLDYVQNDGKTDLGNAVDYICDPVKAGFQTAINCTLDKSFLQMQETKRRWDKHGGILGYHIIHSYAPGEVTPEQAHEAGVEFARRLLGDKYEAVVCTHTDRDPLAGSLTYDTFLETLRRQGYSVKRSPKVKHTAIRPPGGQRFVRLDSLGEGYTEFDLMQRLTEQRHEPEPTPPVFSEQKRYTVRRRPRRYPPVKRGSFRALYLYYLYLLSPRKRNPQKIPFEMRAEIRRAKQYRQQFMLLQKYRVDTKTELDMLSDALSNEMQILVDRRKELYALRREQPSERLDADIDSLTAQLWPLRRELRLCGKIAEYAPRMLKQVQESNSPSTENHLPNKAKERRHSLWR